MIGDELKLHRRSVDEMDVIGVDGDLDSNTVWQFRELTLHLANQLERRWLAINLDQCTYLNATGLGAVIGAYKRRCMVNGRVVLVCTDEKILRMLRITGIDKLLDVVDSEAAAVAKLRAHLAKERVTGGSHG